jgi:hypothetical protein
VAEEEVGAAAVQPAQLAQAPEQQVPVQEEV